MSAIGVTKMGPIAVNVFSKPPISSSIFKKVYSIL